VAKYLAVREVLRLHEGVLADSGGTAGLRDRGALESAVAQPQATFGGEDLYPTLPEKAAALAFGIVNNHPFVDGNKRTALNTTTVFYLLNGRRFEYDGEIREILKQFGINEAAVGEDRVLEYLRVRTTRVDLNDVVEQWRGDFIAYGLDQLSDESSDPND